MKEFDEHLAQWFVQEVQHMPDAGHTFEQLEHVETQLAKVQDTVATVGPKTIFEYTVQTDWNQPETHLVQATPRVVAGMIKVAEAIRSDLLEGGLV